MSQDTRNETNVATHDDLCFNRSDALDLRIYSEKPSESDEFRSHLKPFGQLASPSCPFTQKTMRTPDDDGWRILRDRNPVMLSLIFLIFPFIIPFPFSMHPTITYGQVQRGACTRARDGLSCKRRRRGRRHRRRRRCWLFRRCPLDGTIGHQGEIAAAHFGLGAGVVFMFLKWPRPLGEHVLWIHTR